MKPMKTAAITLLLALAPSVWAQHENHTATATADSGIVTRAADSPMSQGATPGQGGMMGQGGMRHGEGGMMHGAGGMMGGQTSGLSEMGQDAFAAVQEVVRLLEADPATDWSAVNIDALRAHLIDMNLVTIHAAVSTEQVEGGARYVVTGVGDVLASIQRMVPAHATQMASDPAWHASTTLLENGVSLTVHATDPANVAKVRALGFMGFMVQGDHHQPHHLMMVTGSADAGIGAHAEHQH